MIRARFRTSVQGLMIAVLTCALITWFLVGILCPRRFANERFALNGSIDCNRDRRDDRQALKQIILNEGGAIYFELPSDGKASGRLSPVTAWYILDEQLTRSTSARNDRFQRAVLRSAHHQGIRPLPVSRLLARLGKM